MAKKIDTDSMSRAELEEYVKGLPEERPPKMSSAAWLAGFGVVLIMLFASQLKSGDINSFTWYSLVGGIISFIGAGYIVYRVITYNRR